MCVPYIDYDTAREKATEGEKRVRGQCALADRLDPRRSRQALGAMCGSFGVNVHRPEGERERESAAGHLEHSKDRRAGNQLPP